MTITHTHTHKRRCVIYLYEIVEEVVVANVLDNFSSGNGIRLLSVCLIRLECRKKKHVMPIPHSTPVNTNSNPSPGQVHTYSDIARSYDRAKLERAIKLCTALNSGESKAKCETCADKGHPGRVCRRSRRRSFHLNANLGAPPGRIRCARVYCTDDWWLSGLARSATANGLFAVGRNERHLGGTYSQS